MIYKVSDYEFYDELSKNALNLAIGENILNDLNIDIISKLINAGADVNASVDGLPIIFNSFDFREYSVFFTLALAII